VLKPKRAADAERVAVLAIAGAGKAAGNEGFMCSDSICIGRHPSGAVIAHAADAASAFAACGAASVIVVDDATAAYVCPGNRTLVITSRDLARRGSAAITFVRNGREIRSTPQARPTGDHEEAAAVSDGHAVARPAARIEFAIREPYRPWHEHRRFSREARGLPDYRRPR
jgi:competence protein ComEC